MNQSREEKAAVLCAWAQDENATAQYFYDGAWHDYHDYGCQEPPSVFNRDNWRIKPPPKPDEVRFVALDWIDDCGDDEDGEYCAYVRAGNFGPEWDVILKLTRSGETGEVTAEVLK